MKSDRPYPTRLASVLVALLFTPGAFAQTNPDPGSGVVTGLVLKQSGLAGDAYDPLVRLPGRTSYMVTPDRTGMIRLSSSISHTFSGTITTTIRDADGTQITSATGDNPLLSFPSLKYRYPFLITVKSPSGDPVYSGTLISGRSGYSDGPGYVGSRASDSPDIESDGETEISQESEEGDYGEDGKSESSGGCGSCTGSSCDLTNSADYETADAGEGQGTGRFLGGFTAGTSMQGDSSTGVDFEINPSQGVSLGSFKSFGTGDAHITRSGTNLSIIRTSSCCTKFKGITNGVEVSISKTLGGTDYRFITFVNTALNEVTRTSTFAGHSVVTIWTYDPSNDSNKKQWTIVTDNGARKHEVIREDTGTDATLCVERHKLYERSAGSTGEATILVSEVVKTFRKDILGWRKTKVEVYGLTDNPLTTVWEYYGPSDGALKAGLLKSVTRPDNNNETHSYSTNGTYFDHNITRPFASGPASLIETHRKTANSSTSEVYTKVGSNFLSQRKDQWTSTNLIRYDRNGSENHTTNHTIYPFGNDFGGRPTSIAKSDGAAVTQEYLRTGAAPNTTRGLTVEQGSTSGGTVAQGTKTVTTRDSNGVLVTKLESAIGTGEGTVLNSMVASSLDTQGRPNEINYFPGLSGCAWTINRSYACCGLEYESDKFGITTYYDYDGVGRRVKMNRQGVTHETEYDGLTVHTHRYAGLATSGFWTGEADDTNEISYTTRDLSGTIRTSWERSPQTEGGTHNGTSIVDAHPNLAPPPSGTISALCSVSETIFRNPVVIPSDPPDWPVGAGMRRVETHVQVTDDGSNPPIQTTDYYPDGRVKESSGVMSPRVRHSYAVTGTGLSDTQEYVVDSSGKETTVTQYDQVGRKKTVTQAANVTNYHYGDPGLVTGAGKLVKVTDGDGVTTLYAYNSKGERTTTAIDEDGDGTINFNGTDRITVTETNPGSYGGYEVWTTSTSVYAADGYATHIDNVVTTHRSTDGLRSWTLRLGQTGITSTVTTLATLGNHTITTTFPDGTNRKQYYDNGYLVADTLWASGFVPAETAPMTITNVSADGFVSGVAYEYDLMGRIRIETDSRTGPVTTGYCSSTCDYVKSVKDSGDRETLYTYDHRGRRNAVDAPNTTFNNVTLTSYFPGGQVKDVSGDQTYQSSYLYDYADRMTTMKTYGGTPATTTWIYDPTYGRLVEKNYHGENDNPFGINPDNDYTYTNAGRLRQRKWERGVTVDYIHTNGLLTNVNYSDSTPDIGIIYDRLGRQRIVTQVSGGTTNTHTYAYNDDSAVGGGTLGAGLGLYSEAISYGAAGLSRTLVRHQDVFLRPFGWQLKNGASVQHAVSYKYDIAGRLYQVDPSYPLPPSPAFTYGYEAESSGLIQSVTGPIHTVTNTWEATRDVLDTKVNKETVGTPTYPSSFDYTVNPIGQRTKVEPALASINTVLWGWGYNNRGEVVSADHGANGLATTNDQFYKFDGIGNRDYVRTGVLTDSGGTQINYTANGVNQYTVANDLILPDGVSGLSAFDEDGNYRRGPLPVQSANADLVWDAENRLVGATTASAATTYSYDYLGRRISKTVDPVVAGENTVTTNYFYDGWNLIAEFTGSSLTKTYTWGVDLSGSTQGAGGVGGLLAVSEHTWTNDEPPVEVRKPFYPTYDGNGNVSEYLIFDDDAADGKVVAHYEYDAFGNLIPAATLGEKAGDFSHRFSTKPFDPETGLYYYGYRYYDPVTGRWPSRDRIGHNGGMNLYGFLANKGVNFVDFLGDIVVTDQDDAYKKAVVDALEDIVDGIEIEWERFEITTNCNDFDEHNSWKLKIAAWPNIPPNTTDPQKKLILKLLKDLVGGVDAPPLELTVLLFRAHPGQSENIQNAECRCENKLRRGYISENVQIRIPIDSGRKDSDGYPIYDPETGNNFKPTLWHELVGHGILGHGHPKSRQNNEEYKKDGKGSAGGTPPDPAVEVENEARRALGLKERRPTYDNNKKDQQNRD